MQKAIAICCLFISITSLVTAENVTFSTQVAVHGTHRDAKALSSKNIVLWLTPIGVPVPPRSTDQHFQLLQHNKSFEPHVLVVPVGAIVEFPNHDPYFHNVFSLFEGKRFDLGLYESGSTRQVRFDKPGISYIFCNIHAQMSAVVVSLATPYYAVSNDRGEIVIHDVPVGRYEMHIWYERAPDTLKSLTREITLSREDSALAPIQLQAANVPMTHKNKYGHDYDPPEPSSPAYAHP